MSSLRYALFVTCPAGLETLLMEELHELGATDLRETVTGVFCSAELAVCYAINVSSRLANRVILMLAKHHGGDREAIYSLAKGVDWENHLVEGQTIRVDFSGSNDHIRHTQFGARVVKDAIVDKLRELGMSRPNVELRNPAHQINVRLTKKSLYIGLDLSGESLHRRNYRSGAGQAPIKENLAAALLMRAGWPSISKQHAIFLDPMCGSGTFLIEAAYMAAGIAPGILRQRFAFEHWKGHDANLWQSVRERANKHKKEALAALPPGSFVGFESDKKICEQARQNSRHADLEEKIQIRHGELADSDYRASSNTGLILCNPPYGMRLGEVDQLGSDYFRLAQAAKQRFAGWTMGILSSRPELLAQTRLRAQKKYKIFNGPIKCEFRLYQLDDQSMLDSRPNTVDANSFTEGQRSEGTKKRDSDVAENTEMTTGANMVANRIKKNIRRLRSWVKQNHIECYRIYDADIPEYAAAIDVYGKAIHVQEYQAPKTIDASHAKRRFEEVLQAVNAIFHTEGTAIYVKTRKINRGAEQYEKLDNVDEKDIHIVNEARAKLRVNLKAYLDTGLFLDHRLLRLRLAEEVNGKRFLNLFCYTASATVHAALGGALETTSVDMSNTYIQWAQRNFDENNINGKHHLLIRANVFDWLDVCSDRYDMIMLDPPSFSNSKKMTESFDVQRDHGALISRCVERLLTGGVLYFSTNLRRFKLDEAIWNSFSVQDITEDTIDRDFERNRKIHHCFKIERRSP